MKKPLSIILIFLFIISIVGNVTLYLQLNKVNIENQNLNNSIVEIQNSISDLENQLSDVQEQLSDSTTKNEELQENNDFLHSELEQLQSEVEFLKSIEPMSVTMYALEDCDTYSKPDESSDKVTTVEKSASLHVAGRTSNDWYRVTLGNGVVYIKSSLLSDKKPIAPTGSSNSGATNNNNSESTNEPTNPTPNNNNTLNQENVGDILDGLFGPGTGGNESSGTLASWCQV